jgi:Holliday junction resolvase RusA-like endonuclease
MTAPARPRAADALPDILSLKVKLPGTPDIRLSPNRRTPGRTISDLRRRARNDAEITLRAVRNDLGLFGTDPIFTGPTRIRVTVRWEPGRKTWDPDNLTAALKANVDALQRVGIIDNDRNLIWEPIKQERDPEKRGVVVVELGEFKR